MKNIEMGQTIDLPEKKEEETKLLSQIDQKRKIRDQLDLIPKERLTDEQNEQWKAVTKELEELMIQLAKLQNN